MCGEEKDEAPHTIRTCQTLCKQRYGADEERAECKGEETLPKTSIYGVAPAMAADYRKTRWGKAPDGERTRKQRKIRRRVRRGQERKLSTKLKTKKNVRDLSRTSKMFYEKDSATVQAGPALHTFR